MTWTIDLIRFIKCFWNCHKAEREAVWTSTARLQYIFPVLILSFTQCKELTEDTWNNHNTKRSKSWMGLTISLQFSVTFNTSCLFFEIDIKFLNELFKYYLLTTWPSCSFCSQTRFKSILIIIYGRSVIFHFLQLGSLVNFILFCNSKYGIKQNLNSHTSH